MSNSETLPVRKTESILEKIQDAENRIRARAFELFAGHGLFDRDLDNWLKAEDELTLRPSIELCEKDKQFKLKISVPGVEPKAIDIEATPDAILVKAEVHHDHEVTEGDVHTCEFRSGSLFRAVQLPKKIDPDKVKAEVKNGVLLLTADIAEPSRARKVSVKTA
jgi:HSP20 family protein